jgi:predicted hotdog family 3-hydroxylacyl-ACP dehydratase
MPDAIEEIMPHRPPMRWIDALVACTDTTAIATVSFTTDSLAVADGYVLETALVECVAQTVAAAMGHRARADGKSGLPISGMLTSVSDFRILARAPTGKLLHIAVRELRRLGMMMMVSGTVSCEGQTVASGELTLYA